MIALLETEIEIVTIIDCPDCNKGQVRDDWPDRVNRPYEVQLMDCLRCKGRGESESEE